MLNFIYFVCIVMLGSTASMCTLRKCNICMYVGMYTYTYVCMYVGLCVQYMDVYCLRTCIITVNTYIVGMCALILCMYAYTVCVYVRTYICIGVQYSTYVHAIFLMLYRTALQRNSGES